MVQSLHKLQCNTKKAFSAWIDARAGVSQDQAHELAKDEVLNVSLGSSCVDAESWHVLDDGHMQARGTLVSSERFLVDGKLDYQLLTKPYTRFDIDEGMTGLLAVANVEATSLMEASVTLVSK